MAIPLDEIVEALRSAGLEDLAAKATSELPDPVSQDEAMRWGDSHGVSRETLMDRMGGSP